MNPLDDDPRIAAAEWERDHGRDDDAEDRYDRWVER